MPLAPPSKPIIAKWLDLNVIDQMHSRAKEGLGLPDWILDIPRMRKSGDLRFHTWAFVAMSV